MTSILNVNNIKAQSGVGPVAIPSISQAIHDNGSQSGAFAVDLNNGDVQKLTLVGDTTISFSNFAAGQYLTLDLVNAGHVITWPALNAVGGALSLTPIGRDKIILHNTADGIDADALMLDVRVILKTFYEEILDSSPWAFWKLNETSGTVAADSSGNGRNAVYSGSPALGQTALLSGSDFAVDFDAVDDYVGLTSGAPSNPTALSLEFVFSIPAGAPGSQTIASYRSSSDSWFNLNLESDGTLSISANSSGEASVVLNDTVDIRGAGAQHVVMCIETVADEIYLYRNGTLADSDLVSPFSGTFNSTHLIFNATWTGSAFASWADATIDTAAVYTSVLSAADVTNHYNATGI